MMRTPVRPIAVAIVCWILLVGGACVSVPVLRGLLQAYLAGESPMGMWRVVQMGLGAAVAIPAAAAMLAGENWGRWLFIVGQPLATVAVLISALLSGGSLVIAGPALIFCLVALFIITRPAANTYFDYFG